MALSLAIEEHRKKEKGIFKKSLKKNSCSSSSSSSSSATSTALAEVAEMKRRGDDGVESLGRNILYIVTQMKKSSEYLFLGLPSKVHEM